MNAMDGISGKVVVVTGAGKGVGRGLCEGFVADGAHVVGFGREEAPLRAVAARPGPGRMSVVVGDVTDHEDVRRLFAETLDRHGRIDVLVNNAAVYPRTAFLETPIAAWEQAIAVNVLGMAHCCMLALPPMLAAGYGRILNVGSFAWRGPIPGASSYSVSKAAVFALTRAIACEVDPARDVLVNEFLPGVVKTGMSADGISPAEVYPHARHVVLQPKGSPHGVTYLQSEVWQEYGGWRSRLRNLLQRITGRK